MRSKPPLRRLLLRWPLLRWPLLGWSPLRWERASLAILISLLLSAGASPAAAQLFTLSDLSGEELFGRFCSACHGAEGVGNGPVAASLSTPVPDLTRLAARNGGEFPGDAVREIIDGRSVVVAHGTRTMPVWGYEFWVEEGADRTAEADAREAIRRLVQYLAEIQASD